MVTEEKLISNIISRYHLGSMVIWLGVFTWAPSIFRKAMAEKSPFLLFLPFHLLGVIGARLRSIGRGDELSAVSDQRRIRWDPLYVLNYFIERRR